MLLHRSWWRVVLADPTLIPVPLDQDGLPDLHAHQIPEQSMRGSWLLIAPANARLCPDFAEVLRREARIRPEVGIFYADEVEEAGPGPKHLQLKPAMNLALQIADDYMGSPLMVLHSVFQRLRGFGDGTRTAVIYDFLLRAIQAGIGIECIPAVMIAHNGRRPRPLIDDRRRAVANWIVAADESLEIEPGLTEASLQLRRHFATFPEVTLVIATRQARQHQVRDGSFDKAHIVNFLESLTRTDWPLQRMKILIGDDVPDELIYAGGNYPFEVRRIDTQRAQGVPFNYAAKMNSLWRKTDTEFVIFMNDDIVVREAGWLRALMTFAMDENVGGVGARLLYADGRLQHAGIAGGLLGLCAHAWIYAPAQAKTYNDWALVHREWSMVTGAVFATRRRILELVNGFDERFSLEFNDVDLCMRMRLLGYKILYTPFAEMTHYEKASREDARPKGGQVALFLKRWGELLNHDPAFHPGFDMQNVYLDPVPIRGAWFDRDVA
jgi:GT2 family glycosyltransferase